MNSEDNRNRYYNYFENEVYDELDIPKDRYLLGVNSILEYVNKNKNISNIVSDLEKKIRLIFNIPVAFPIVNMYIYDNNEQFISKIIVYRDFSIENRLKYVNDKNFFENSKFNYNVNEIEKIQQNHSNFKKAMDFFYYSFDSSSLATRYIIIFSALESLFNLDADKIKEKLGKYSSRIMCFDDIKKECQVYTRIKSLYNKRCDYIHGRNTFAIKMKDEIELREYVRKIIIIYMNICIIYSYTDKEIIWMLDNNIKLGFQIRIIAKRINSTLSSAQFYNEVIIPEAKRETLKGNLEIISEENGITQIREKE